LLRAHPTPPRLFVDLARMMTFVVATGFV
jgi:hypothetical protein